MTNGEKIQWLFPNAMVDIGELAIYVWLDSKNGIATEFTDEWWNAEYKEPTSKNCESCRYYGSHHEVCKYCYECSLWTQGESTTENDLAVDCIDRVELLKAMDTWDKVGYITQYGIKRLDKDDKDFVPYVKYDDMVNCVKGMPSVTPQEPKPMVEIDLYSVIKQKYIEREVLDKIRAEIASLSNANPSYWHSGDMVEREEVLDIIDKYKAE